MEEGYLNEESLGKSALEDCYNGPSFLEVGYAEKCPGKFVGKLMPVKTAFRPH